MTSLCQGGVSADVWVEWVNWEGVIVWKRFVCNKRRNIKDDRCDFERVRTVCSEHTISLGRGFMYVMHCIQDERRSL